MKRLLDDYRFDDRLWYEAHALHYLPEKGDEIIFGGIMGAAVLWTLLADTDEGDARSIIVDGEAQREELFVRYEREVRRDNGGLFETEVETLSQVYIEMTGTEDVLLRICGNDRMFDLAFGLAMDYMQRLVQEQVRAHIYEAEPWHMPFAQWLLDAGQIETYRQHLLSIDWSNAAEVYALAQTFNTPQNESAGFTFYFEGEKAEELLNLYFEWLWKQVQAEASMMPDAQVQLAQIRSFVLEQETNWDFIKPELKVLEPEDLNLFRKWMNQWIDFIRQQLGYCSAPPRTDLRQEFFLDEVLSCPKPNSYSGVREYIRERSRYDKIFKKFVDSQKRTTLCNQLSLMFGWTVDPNSLGHSLKRKLKHPRKDHLK